MVKTVCGTETNEQITLDYNGERYIFCEEACEDELLAAPDKKSGKRGININWGVVFERKHSDVFSSVELLLLMTGQIGTQLEPELFLLEQ